MISILNLIEENLLLEAAPVDFRLFDGDNIARRAEYRFEIDDVIMSCIISAAKSEGFYEVSFKRSVVGDYEERLNKGMKFMFTVIATVTECVKDFIKRNGKVKAVIFSAEASKTSAYLRHISNSIPNQKVAQTASGAVVFIDPKAYDERKELKNSFHESEKFLEDLFIQDTDLDVDTNLTVDRNTWAIQVMGNLKSNKNIGALTVRRREDGSYNVMTNYNIAIPAKRSAESKIFKDIQQARQFILKSLPK